MKRFAAKFDDKQLDLLVKDCRKKYSKLWDTKFYDKERIKKIQEERFLKILHYAYENIPMYKNLYDKHGVDISSIKCVADIKKLPIIEKDTFIKNYPDNTISKKYNPNDLREIVSGGSTGQTVKMAQSEETIRMRVLTAFRIYDTLLNRYEKDHVQTYVYTTNYPLDSLLDGSYKLVNVWTLDPIDVACKKIVDSKPHLLTLYPSVLEEIRKNLTNADLAIIKERLKAINVKSELSTPEQRKEWEEFFGVGVYDEYGSEELCGTVAAQCLHKGYHIWEDINIVEALDEDDNPCADGELGELIGTNLYNFAMPVIRFRQGDLVSLKSEDYKCPCGCNFRLIDKFEGRKNMSFTLKSGRFLSSGYLLDVGYTKLIEFREALASWAIIQEKIDKVIFECIPTNHMNDDISKKISSAISESLYHEADVEVRFVKEIPKSARGKRNQIISLVK